MDVNLMVQQSLIVEQLRKEGLVIRQWTSQLPGFVEDLKRAPMYRTHVAAKDPKFPMEPLTYEEAVQTCPVFAPYMFDVIKAPGFFELALGYFDVALQYFDGKFPYLYSINAFWTTPNGDGLYRDTQEWHRDGDDKHQFTLFLYGTDVLKEEDGAHLFQKGTHRHNDEDVFGWGKVQEPVSVETLLGPAGTLIICDTNGMHKAIKPTTKPRLLVWARYSTACPPQSYAWDQLSPLPRSMLGMHRYPQDPKLRESIKLVVS